MVPGLRMKRLLVICIELIFFLNTYAKILDLLYSIILMFKSIAKNHFDTNPECNRKSGAMQNPGLLYQINIS